MPAKRHPGEVRYVYPRRMQEIRASKNWTKARLAEEMKTIGFPVDGATVANGEERP